MPETPSEDAPRDDTQVDHLDSTIGGEGAHTPNAALKAGTRVGRFEIGNKLGSGGMGIVYEAHDTDLGRKIALKLLASSRPGSTASERLLREAQAMARLAHPNVAAVHEVGRFGERVFLAMELIDGPSLDVWLGQQEREWTERLRMLVDAGEGLVAAHAAGFVHRDFKPANVMVGADGRPRVLDFGLVRASGAETEPGGVTPTGETGETGETGTRHETGTTSVSHDRLSAALTHAGAIMGTPAYMAPEQFAGLEVDERSDQFSFCVAVYEAIYGQRPYVGATMSELMLARSEPPRFPERSPVPRAVAKILTRGLAQAPERRWPSMSELLAELRAQLELHADPERDRAVGRRQRGLLLLGLCTAMILVVIAMESADPAVLLSEPVPALKVMTGLTAIGLAIVLGGARFVGRNRINRQLIRMVLSFQVGIWLNRVIAVPLALAWPEVYLLDLALLTIVGLLGATIIHRSLVVVPALAAIGLGVACWQPAWAPNVSLITNLSTILSVVLIWRGGSRDQAQAEAAMSTSQSRTR